MQRFASVRFFLPREESFTPQTSVSVLQGGLKHAHHVGPGSYSHNLLAVSETLKASATVAMAIASHGRIDVQATGTPLAGRM